MFEYLKGRSGRKEYWASVGILVLVGIALAVFRIPGAGAATTFLWILIWSRRLHDMGKSAWWVMAPIGVMVVICVAAFALLGGPLMDAMKYSETGNGKVTDQGATLFVALVIALFLIQLAFTIWLGVVKGEVSDNRFGPPPAR